MYKLLVLLCVLMLITPITSANRCLALPNYILDTEILSCKLVVSEKNDNSKTVVVNVQVTDEIVFSSTRPISWKKLMEEEPSLRNNSLRGKKVALLFKGGEFSCLSAQRNRSSIFYVSALCCTAGSPWCPEANHRGFVLPSPIDWEREHPRKFDSQYDFKETDVIKEFE